MTETPAEPQALDVALAEFREMMLIHGLDVDFDAQEVHCNCGNFAGTTTFMEHLTAALGVALLDLQRAAR